VDVNRRAGGGEYPTQDGFGWSNGVAEAFAAQPRTSPPARTRTRGRAPVLRN
jgi:alpha,alpha-trehalase